MENVDLKSIDIIVPLRIDNPDRLENLIIQKRFFDNTTINCNIIYVEQDTEQKFPGSHFIKSEKEELFNKCLCYNTGLELVKTEYVCCLDSDLIFNPENLLKSIGVGDICIGYNKTSLYLNYEAKKIISNKPELETLHQIIRHATTGVLDSSNNFKITNFYIVPLSNAVGGCLVCNTDILRKIKGFNTKFRGWGYEDNEIVVRAHKLGYNVVSLKDANAVVFHLPHTQSIITVKEAEIQNTIEMRKIDNMSVDEIIEYTQRMI